MSLHFLPQNGTQNAAETKLNVAVIITTVVLQIEFYTFIFDWGAERGEGT